MYLNILNEEQKELFVDMCIYVALSNNQFAEEEKHCIDLYCQEMGIETPRYEARASYNATVEAILCSCGTKEIKIIAMELAALVLSDSKYEQLEKDFMSDLVCRFGISSNEFEALIKNIQVLNATYSELDKWIRA